MNCCVTLTTAHHPGAVAILQLHGPDAQKVLQDLTGYEAWIPGHLRLCDIANLDAGLVVLLNPGTAQLMPHGGPRVVQKILDHLQSLHVAYEPSPDPQSLYPEAKTSCEADMLHALAHAASPAAIDLLVPQPSLWNAYLQASSPKAQALPSTHDSFDHLLIPARVVVVGQPNVGKSTLLNAMVGQVAAITEDRPGTTRDYVGAQVDLQGIRVHWLDTPGLRASSDPVEQQAIIQAQQVIRQADVLIAMRDPQTPHVENLPRRPDLFVVNKVDRPVESLGDELSLSAKHRWQLDILEQRILQILGLDDLALRLWAFSPALKALIHPSPKEA